MIFGKNECMTLTHCGLVTPYGNRDLGQHWLWYWLIAWRHQAITWTNVDLSSSSKDIHLEEISWEMSQPSIAKKNFNHLTKTLLKSPRGQWVNDDNGYYKPKEMGIPVNWYEI